MSAPIQQRLRSVVQSVSNQSIPEDPEESLFESGLLDSNNLVDVVSAIEAEFSIKVPDADLTPRKFDSLARMESYVTSHAS